MINSFANIDSGLINQVCTCFEENYDFNYLKDKFFFLDHNVLFSILYSSGIYRDKIYNHLVQETISENKIIILSDTHYGSKYENINYTYSLFNFAVSNGIHIILHGGDIIESDINKNREYYNLKQAEYFTMNYPYDKSIMTYALLGNHDYLAISSNERVRDILNFRRDVNILGFKKVYFNWCDNIISLQHEIDKFKLNLPVKADVLCFKGHSHYYHTRSANKYKNERIYIPPMCIDPVYFISNIDCVENKVKPGFLVAELDENNILVTHYSFIDGMIVREDEFIKVLKR